MPTARKLLSSTRIWDEDGGVTSDKGTATAKRRQRRRLQPVTDDEDVENNLMMVGLPQLSSIAPPSDSHRGDSSEGMSEESVTDDDRAADLISDRGGVSDDEDPQRSPSGNRERSAAEVDEDVDADVLNRLRKLTKGAAKRVVKNPRPKLDTIRLLSNRGLPALLSDFKKVKFKGRGHEFTDLDRLLFTYKAWAHRLIPKLNFPEVVDRLEKLGSRRDVHVTLHRLREGVWPPARSDEFVHDFSEDSGDEAHLTATDDRITDPEDAWNAALPTSPTGGMTIADQRPPSDSGPVTPLADLSNQQHASPPGPSWRTGSEASDAERAERNRRLALQRLASRQPPKCQVIPSAVASPTGRSSLLKAAFKASQPASTIISPGQISQPSAQDGEVRADDQQAVIAAGLPPRSPDGDEAGNSPRPLEIHLSPSRAD